MTPPKRGRDSLLTFLVIGVMLPTGFSTGTAIRPLIEVGFGLANECEAVTKQNWVGASTRDRGILREHDVS